MISTLASPNPESWGLFGWSVGTRGNTVVVGAPSESANGLINSGHVYTFNAETGSLISILTSPNAQVGSGFGLSVAASGNILVLGAPFADLAYTSRLPPANR